MLRRGGCSILQACACRDSVSRSSRCEGRQVRETRALQAKSWFLFSMQMEVISARAGFENAFPGDSHAWKMHSFLQVRRTRYLVRFSSGDWWCVRAQVQNKLQMEAVTNLISVGDSHIEMDAVHLLGRSFAHALVKTVKLWERPTPYELVGSSQ